MDVAALRVQLGHLTTLAGADLAAIFRDLERGAYAGESLFDLLPALIAQYGPAAASITADWYDQARLAAQVKARFAAIPADIKDSGAEALVGWARSQTTDPVVLEQLIRGGMTRRILNYSRQTVMTSTLADPGAHGWSRAGSGESCTFCNMLIGRGAVYSANTADFASHDHCNCSAVPAFKDQPKPVKPYIVGPRREIDPDTGKPIPDADFERAKQWIKDHPDG